MGRVKPQIPTMAEKPREIEAKLSGSIESFRALERLEEIAGWRVVERHSVSCVTPIGTRPTTVWVAQVAPSECVRWTVLL